MQTYLILPNVSGGLYIEHTCASDCVDAPLDNPNGLQEFDYTPQNLTFNTTQNDDVISPMIRIVEDQINDAEQQFICIVKVFDTSLITSGSVIIGHPSVVIRIVDDDSKSW